jgi:hypothetical protein
LDFVPDVDSFVFLVLGIGFPVRFVCLNAQQNKKDKASYGFVFVVIQARLYKYP